MIVELGMALQITGLKTMVIALNIATMYKFNNKANNRITVSGIRYLSNQWPKLKYLNLSKGLVTQIRMILVMQVQNI